jgi:hypothetical protein
MDNETTSSQKYWGWRCPKCHTPILLYSDNQRIDIPKTTKVSLACQACPSETEFDPSEIKLFEVTELAKNLN